MSATAQNPAPKPTQLTRRGAGDETDGAGHCWYTTHAMPAAAGPILLLRFDGEIDLVTIPVLHQALTSGMQRRPGCLLIDLAPLRFCSVRALAELVQGGRTATDAGVGYAVAGIPAELTRICDQTWPGDLRLPYPDAATAITALRAERAAERTARPRRADV